MSIKHTFVDMTEGKLFLETGKGEKLILFG